MEVLSESINQYLTRYPMEPVLIISDHGMSSINNKVDLQLEMRFGKQRRDEYIAYSDSTFMCVWVKRPDLLLKIRDFLDSIEYGHLLTENERKIYKATDRKFGDLIFILREGNVFSNNWFGKSIREPSSDGSSMHGFWPESDAKDQMACIMLINSKSVLAATYDYSSAYSLINRVLNGRQI